MSFLKYCPIFFFVLVLDCYALNCRTNVRLKESELKSTYMNCLKKQGSTNTTGNSQDQEWNQPRRNNQKNYWNKNVGNNYPNQEDNMESKNVNRNNRNGNIDNKRNSDETTGMKDQVYGNRNQKDDSNKNSGDDNYESNKRRINNRMGDNNFSNNDQFTERNFAGINKDFGGDNMPNYKDFGTTYNYNPTDRFKREKRPEKNSGQRSQYNPNSKRNSWQEESHHSEEKNSSESNKEYDIKACALHCFMEELKMVGVDGMPDRYLATHVITKDVKNEDLKDFLEESIEDCFKIVDNEDSDDKCKFAKDFMMCLSEKGRANCDDWKDDVNF